MTLLRTQLGYALRRARNQRGLTLREVSAIVPTSIGYLSEIETGRKEASSEMLESVCAALEIPLSRLLRDTASFAQLSETPIPDTPAELVNPNAPTTTRGVRSAAAIAETVAREGVDEEIDAGVYN